MASLREQAEAARSEAERLRREERRLRAEQRALAHQQRRLVVGASLRLARIAESRTRPRPSPWSGLAWRQPSRDLDDVLFASE